MGNIAEAIVDLLKTVSSEIGKPETKIHLEPLEEGAEEKPSAVEPVSSESVPETTEPKEEQIIIKTPTILTKLDKIGIPERFEEETI